MTKQATIKAATVTAKQGKPSTAEKQAKPALTIRSSVATWVKGMKQKETSLANHLMKGVDLYLSGDLNEKEQAAMLGAVPKQRKADFRAIVEGPANYRAESEYPKGLQARARYMKMRAAGYAPADAASIANHKESRKQVDERLGKTPTAGKAGNQPGDTEERTTPVPEEIGGLADLDKALAKLTKECREYSPEARQALNAVLKAAESLSKAMANG